MDEDVMSGRASLVADDGKRENFHRSARTPPATCRHAGHLTRCYDIAGQSLTSRLCRVPGPTPTHGARSPRGNGQGAQRYTTVLATLHLPRDQALAAAGAIDYRVTLQPPEDRIVSPSGVIVTSAP
jgi:hypothetical protein